MTAWDVKFPFVVSKTKCFPSFVTFFTEADRNSAPKVLARPGEEATIKVETEYIYPTDYVVQLQSSSSGGSGNSGGSSQSAIPAVVEPQSFQMREVGVILQVTPTLTDDGTATLTQITGMQIRLLDHLTTALGPEGTQALDLVVRNLPAALRATTRKPARHDVWQGRRRTEEPGR